MTPRNEPRRPSLATIVGSSLAVAAAGSLIAFGSLAEQAGLQGLAVGGLQPAQPERSGGRGHAITVPAPSTAPPEDPREALAELVRETIERDRTIPPTDPSPIVTFTPAPRERDDRTPRDRRDRRDPVENQARVAVAEPEVEPADSDGPPYGHAYGHDKKGGPKPKSPKPPEKKDGHKARTHDQPVYARTANEGSDDAPKAPKMKKVKPANGNGKAKGHEKHAAGNGNGNGKAKAKAKGHSKHGNGNGNGKAKGKGHAKHGG